MGVKNDKWLKKHGHQIFHPFVPLCVSEGISYGVGSYGYDVRLGREFLIPPQNGTMDPKHPPRFKRVIADVIKAPPSSVILGMSMEYLKIPRDTLAICTGKSTYARAGLIVNITPLEPEWEGHITISLINATSHHIMLYAGEGIAQVIFFSADEVCEISYRDRKGKYQAQKNVTPSIVINES